ILLMTAPAGRCDDHDREVFDFDARRLRMLRQLGKRGAVGTPKSGVGRDVDLSHDVAAVIRQVIAKKRPEKLKWKWAALPGWTFVTTQGTPYTARNVLRAWYAVQHRAKLLDAHGAPRFDLKSLRHTFASLHILNGCTLAWLQEQMGHADIRLTRSTYGRWFK